MTTTRTRATRLLCAAALLSAPLLVTAQRLDAQGQRVGGNLVLSTQYSEDSDAGIAADGQPYLALEYVAGEPITRYCEHHQLDLRNQIG